ncbi:MAG: PEP-CTERM sorting domain-containing protein [Anaerohalosphaeraceae bacterium]
MKKNITVVMAALLVVTSGLVSAGAVIGVNFTDGWGTPCLAGETADGLSNWTDSRADGDWTDPSKGTGLVVLGSSDLVTCDWSSANTWAAGQEATSEQQPYRVYLDDGGNGALVTISGLSAWLAAEGATGYTVRIYHSTDNGSGFMGVDITDGSVILETVQETNHWTTDGGIRAFVDSGMLTANSIVLDPLAKADGNRATIAAFKITAIPEPATMVLLALGGLVLRRKHS